MEYKKIEKTVDIFLKKCSEEIGKLEENIFTENTYMECLEYGKDSIMTSPIEHILYIALQTIRRLNDIDECDMHFIPIDEEKYRETWRGLSILPQVKIEKYRCDFKISYDFIEKNNEKAKIILVECDSQEFHERTEEERRYEKARDRYFTKKGYKIFHFTGSEILKRPLEIAKEILEFVTSKDLIISTNEIWK